MKNRGLRLTFGTLFIAGFFGCIAHALSSSSAHSQAQQNEKAPAISNHARGTFEVKIAPQGSDDKAEGTTLGRMSLDKQFQGDLQGTSKGEMLTAFTGVKGSAGYVAMERFNGTLNGRTGAFVLQHTGTMTRGALQLTITVVPDSASGQLAGLTGNMKINIVEGKHFYDFEYTLADAR